MLYCLKKKNPDSSFEQKALVPLLSQKKQYKGTEVSIFIFIEFAKLDEFNLNLDL